MRGLHKDMTQMDSRLGGLRAREPFGYVKGSGRPRPLSCCPWIRPTSTFLTPKAERSFPRVGTRAYEGPGSNEMVNLLLTSRRVLPAQEIVPKR
jgi:hypothetical protein